MITIDSIVYYKDDLNKHPYLVHKVLEGENVILGLKEYPNSEQDYITQSKDLGIFEGEEARQKAKEIYNLIDE